MASKRARRRRRRRSRRLAGDVRNRRRGSRSGGGPTPIRTASISGVRGAIAKALLKSRIGKRIATIARQKISKVPGIGRLAGRTRRARGDRPGLIRPARTGRELATRPQRSIARRTTIAAAKVAAGGAAFEAGSTLFANIRGEDVVRKFSGRRTRAPVRRGVPFTPGTVVPTDSITHSWVANGVPFAQLADGRVMVRKKNGVVKTFRRPRPIVLGRNPGIRDISRAYKKIDTLLKVMRKHFPAQKTRTQSRAHRSVDV